MGKESRMRNDVKLGLAVGGLLLGVVLAYALFFSNTSKDRDKELAGSYSALENNNSGQRPAAPSNTAERPATTVRPAPPSVRETTAREATTLAEPPPAPSGPRRYTIKHGDTFWLIAKSEYGNGAYFGAIQRANPGIDPGRIKAGDSIILPDKNDVIAPAAATARQPSAAELVIDPAKQYRVQAGDNLSTISKKLYGRYDKWTQIYELNKDLIGPNPGALKRDMILALPEPPIRIAGTIQ